MNKQLTHSEYDSICSVIAARIGLHFPPDRWPMLERNLVSAATDFGFNTKKSFISWLLSADLNQMETDILAKHLTITETYFWREPQVFNALTGHVLPNLTGARRNGNKTLRIWSAGCSTGEEAYSLAIALHQTIPDIKDWKITILATDINPKALEKAARGVYTAWSFRNCPNWIITKYFHVGEGSTYTLIPEIRKMVTFAKLNLTELNYPNQANNTHSMDLIFCRNVLMYFTGDWIDQIIENLYSSMDSEGWFVVSSCELSAAVFPQFTAVNFPGAIFYSKARRELPSLPPIAVTQIPMEVSAKPYMNLQNQDQLSNPSLTKALLVPLPVEPTGRSEEVHAANDESTASINLKIRMLADLGHLFDALALCDESITHSKLDIGLYFLRSSILVELDRVNDAVLSLKKAIYLDSNFILGHFTLGNLLIGQGKPKPAIRYLQNSLDLLNNCAPDDILPESEGLEVRYFREIVEANLQSQRIL